MQSFINAFISKRSEISLQTILLYSAQLVGTVLNFLSTYFIAKWMGVEGFGFFAFCLNILVFSSLFFEFGVFSAGARLLAIGENEKKEHEIFGALFLISLVLGLVMAGCIVLVAPIIDRLYHAQVEKILWSCAPLIIFIPLQYLLELACQGKNKISSLALLRIAIPAFSFTSIAIVFVFHQLTPIWALLAATTGQSLACLLVALSLQPSFQNLSTHVKEILLETRRFGVHVYLGRVMAMASQKIDGLLIPYFGGYTPLGYYVIGKNISDSLLVGFSRAFGMTRFRTFARSTGISPKLILWNCLLLGTMGIGLLITMPYLLPIVLPKYLGTIPLLLPFVIAGFLGGGFQPYNIFLTAQGHGGEMRNISILVGLAQLSVLSIAIPLYSTIGAAWGISIIAGFNFFLHYYHYNQTQRSLIQEGKIPLKITIVNLCGNNELACNWARSIAPKVEINIIDKSRLKNEKKLSLVKFLRTYKTSIFAVYCDRLEWQTLCTPMLIFGLFSGARTCVIVDVIGNKISRSALSVVLFEIPHLILEIIGGIALIAISWIATLYLELEVKMGISKQKRQSAQFGNPIKLMFIRTTPASGAQTGGAASHILGFTQGAVAQGVKVQFLSNDAISGINPDITPISIITPSSFFTAHRVFFELWNNIVFTIQAINRVKAESVDYIYQRYSRFNWTGVVLSQITGIPLLLEFNGSEVWIGKHWDNVQLIWLLEAFERLNLNAATSIFVVSEVEKQNLLKRNFLSEKIYVNPNGVNPEVFYPNCGGKLVRDNLKLDSNIIVGFVGTFGPWHGVEIIAKAAAMLPSDSLLHFLLIGEGAVKDKVENLVKIGGCSNRFTFMGRVAHSKVAAYLDACDILVSPQVQPEDGGEFFGSPTKLFEYMAMAKAIIASDVGQMSQIIENGKTGILIPPSDPKSLALALEKLAQNSQLRSLLGQEARNAVIKHYTWEHNAKNVLNTVSNI